MEPQLGNNIEVYFNENGTFKNRKEINSRNLFTSSIASFYNKELDKINLVSANFNNNFEMLDFKTGNYIRSKLTG